MCRCRCGPRVMKFALRCFAALVGAGVYSAPMVLYDKLCGYILVDSIIRIGRWSNRKTEEYHSRNENRRDKESQADAHRGHLSRQID